MIHIKEDPPITIYTEKKQKKLNANIQGKSVIKKGTYPPITFTYSIDEKGRRKTYQSYGHEKKFNVLFVGCSFTFGTGVNDEETFPSQFAIRNPHCNVYNYGIPGGSLQEIYLTTLDPKFAEDIQNLPTVVVYTFIFNHMKRLIGNWSIIGRWGRYLPNIEVSNGELHNLGPFATTKPFEFFLANNLFKSTLISTFLDHTSIDYPSHFKEKDFELLHLIILKIQENLSQKLSDVHMVFLFFPGSTKVIPELYNYLTLQNKYMVIDYLKDINEIKILRELEERKEHKFPDGHPKPIIYSYLAEWLTEDLKNRKIIP